MRSVKIASAYARGALCASLLRTPLARASSSALRSARVVMRKRLGQHLLTNPDVVANIVAHARIAPGERVFEIGPGTGNLTAHLLASPAAVVFAVELDERLFSLLQSRADALPGGSKLQCVRGDFLRVPLPTFDVLVANIPYQISSPVLRRLFAHTPLPRAAVIMFQAEFAERMVARPGGATYCRLSVNCQLLASVRLVQRVAASQFRPPPKVDSAVVLIEPRGWPPGLDFPDWDGLLRAAFASKNKTLRSLLAGSKTALAGLALLRVGRTAGGDAPASAAADVVHTSVGSVSRSELAQTRTDVLSVLSALGALEWRANAMPIAAFSALHDALRGAGFRFARPRASHVDGSTIPGVDPFSVDPAEEEGGVEAEEPAPRIRSERERALGAHAVRAELEGWFGAGKAAAAAASAAAAAASDSESADVAFDASTIKARPPRFKGTSAPGSEGAGSLASEAKRQLASEWRSAAAAFAAAGGYVHE